MEENVNLDYSLQQLITGLTFTTYINLFLPCFHLSFQSLHLCDQAHRFWSIRCVDRLLFEVRSWLLNMSMELGHLVTEHASESAQHLLVPGVVFERYLRLDFAKLNNNWSYLFLCLRSVKCLSFCPVKQKKKMPFTSKGLFNANGECTLSCKL